MAATTMMPPGELTLPGLLKGRLRRRPVAKPVPAAAPPPTGSRWLAGSYSNTAGTRAYKVYVPSRYCGKAVPLVVMLHGCTQNPDDFAAGTGMNVLAEAGEFLVVYPAQAIPANNSRCWNWFQAAHQQRERGKPSLIAGITRQVMAEYQIDASRVYVAGMSAGGAMAAIMGATYPDLYAAVGVHSGLAPGSAHDLPSALQAMQRGGQAKWAGAGRAIPLILFQGDADTIVHPCNAKDLVRQWTAAVGPGTAAGTAPAVMVRQGQAASGRTYTCASYHDGGGQTVVEQWTIHGAGHAWSGGSPGGSYTDSDGPDASREFVRFFLEHPGKTTVPPPVG